MEVEDQGSQSQEIGRKGEREEDIIIKTQV